jgi:hypothetical protein
MPYDRHLSYYKMISKINWIETSILLISYIWPIQSHSQCEWKGVNLRPEGTFYYIQEWLMMNSWKAVNNKKKQRGWNWRFGWKLVTCHRIISISNVNSSISQNGAFANGCVVYKSSKNNPFVSRIVWNSWSLHFVKAELNFNLTCLT